MEALSSTRHAHPEAVRQHRRQDKVFTTVGPEQEYFLIDKNFYFARPDLINAGRTLFGAKPPKGQELEDQYFGTIPERVLACMAGAEAELFKLGVPVKTRHNEVAPSQYEIAPIFENSNLATDHQMLIDGSIREDCRRNMVWLACSTKSRLPASTAPASTTTGRCPPTPARTCSIPATRRTTTPSSSSSASPSSGPSQSIRSCCACRWLSAANDHRLGANEAPPAIISIFLGDQLQDVIDQLEAGQAEHAPSRAASWRSASAVLPKLPQGCRRPQPHQPVCLHRQQVRVPRRRRSQSIAGPNTVLNTIVAESLDFIATQLEKAVKAGKELNKAIQDLLAGIIKESKKVIFNGDNYSEEWHKEAEKRGLPNLQEHGRCAAGRSCARRRIDLFAKYKVYSERELQSRYDDLERDYTSRR